jgi:hypothetical protein
MAYDFSDLDLDTIDDTFAEDLPSELELVLGMLGYRAEQGGE